MQISQNKSENIKLKEKIDDHFSAEKSLKLLAKYGNIIDDCLRDNQENLLNKFTSSLTNLDSRMQNLSKNQIQYQKGIQSSIVRFTDDKNDVKH